MVPRVHLSSVFLMMQRTVSANCWGVGLEAGGGGQGSETATAGSSADNGERRGRVWLGGGGGQLELGCQRIALGLSNLRKGLDKQATCKYTAGRSIPCFLKDW